MEGTLTNGVGEVQGQQQGMVKPPRARACREPFPVLAGGGVEGAVTGHLVSREGGGTGTVGSGRGGGWASWPCREEVEGIQTPKPSPLSLSSPARATQRPSQLEAKAQGREVDTQHRSPPATQSGR